MKRTWPQTANWENSTWECHEDTQLRRDHQTTQSRSLREPSKSSNKRFRVESNSIAITSNHSIKESWDLKPDWNLAQLEDLTRNSH